MEVPFVAPVEMRGQFAAKYCGMCASIQTYTLCRNVSRRVAAAASSPEEHTGTQVWEVVVRESWCMCRRRKLHLIRRSPQSQSRLRLIRRPNQRANHRLRRLSAPP